MDESGDTGLKFGAGSSNHFVITAVVFEDPAAADLCRAAIQGVKASLGMRQHAEFKFNKLCDDFRLAFFKEAARHDFLYFAVVLDKTRLASEGFQVKESLYKFALNLLFQNARSYIADATVVIDRSGGRDFRQELKTYLNRRMREDDGSSVLKRFRDEPSHCDPLLQLVDMVAGAVARSFQPERTNWDTYRNLILGQEVRVQKWPE